MGRGPAVCGEWGAVGRWAVRGEWAAVERWAARGEWAAGVEPLKQGVSRCRVRGRRFAGSGAPWGGGRSEGSQPLGWSL